MKAQKLQVYIKKKNRINKNNIGTFVGVIFDQIDNEFKKKAKNIIKENEESRNVIEERKDIKENENENSRDLILINFEKDSEKTTMKFSKQTTVKKVLEEFFKIFDTQITLDVDKIVFMYNSLILNSPMNLNRTISQINRRNEMLVRVIDS